MAADPSLLGGDRVHPGAAGTRAFAAAIREKLAREIGGLLLSGANAVSPWPA